MLPLYSPTFCTVELGCTNVTKWQPHPRPTRPDAVTREQRHCLCVNAESFFFFFFSFSFFRFPTQADSVQTWANSHWIGPIRADSGHIGPYQAKLPIQAEIKFFFFFKKVRNAPSHVSLSPPIHSRLTSQLNSSYSLLSVRLQLHASTVW